jgi:hypothetical protein
MQSTDFQMITMRSCDFSNSFHITTNTPSNLISSLISMAFADIYSNILEPFIQSYKEAKNQKTRAVVIQNAADAVTKSRDLLEDTAVALPKDLKTVCPYSFCFSGLCCSLLQAVTRYIKGHLDNKKEGATVESADPKPKKLKQVYSIRDVVKEQYRARIEAEIPYKTSDKEFIGCYQRALTAVLNNMSDEDVEAAESILETWNQQGAPAEVQLK